MSERSAKKPEPDSPDAQERPGEDDSGIEFEPESWFEPTEPQGVHESISLEGSEAGAAAKSPEPEIESEPLVIDRSNALFEAVEGKGTPLGTPEPKNPSQWIRGSEAPATTPLAEESEDVAEVRRLVAALAKAVKATRMYPLDNPVCKGFASDLVAAFNQAFTVLEEVRLTVGKTKFFFRGEMVLEQPGREESVPGRFFWDGIREVTFREGLTSEEIHGFLDICRIQSETAAEGEDDLVTLFWQKDFEHVFYIAVDDILDLENPDDPVPEEFGTEYMNFVDLEMHDMEEDEETQKVTNDFAAEIQARINEKEMDLFGVSQEDRDALLVELEHDESPKVLEDIFQILFETIYLDHDPVSFVETVDIIAQALVGLIGEGRMMVAAGLVRMMAEVRDGRDDLTPPMKAGIDEGIAQGWGPDSTEALTHHLNAGFPDVIAGLPDFVRLLPDEATPTLCSVLVKLENQRARRQMADALAHLAASGAGVDVYLPYLKDPDPEVVQEMIVLLGQTRSDRAVRPLRELLRHPVVDVRCQAIDALCQLGPAKAGDVVINALYDRDQRVRMAAARGLGKAGRIAIPSLVQVIQESAFKDRELQEKKAYYRALARAGGEDMTHFMEDSLKTKSLFNRTYVEEIRACSAEALGIIGGPKALALLQHHMNDKSTMVRNAVRAGLRRISESPEEDRREAA